MAQFKKLKLLDGAEVFVNSESVRYVTARPGGATGAMVYFDREHSILVDGEPRQVIEQLRLSQLHG